MFSTLIHAAYKSSHRIKCVDLVCLYLYIDIDLLHDHSFWKPLVQSTSQMPTKLLGEIYHIRNLLLCQSVVRMMKRLFCKRMTMTMQAMTLMQMTGDAQG
jgi:hypothetical protein